MLCTRSADEIVKTKLLESIDGAKLQRADDIFANGSDRGLGCHSASVHRRGTVSSAGGLQPCSTVTRQLVQMCRCRLSQWVTDSWSLCGLLVFEICSASWLCAVLLFALRMPLRGLLGLKAAHRLRGAETCVQSANAVPRAVWPLKTALFGPMTVPDHDSWAIWHLCDPS